MKYKMRRSGHTAADNPERSSPWSGPARPGLACTFDLRYLFEDYNIAGSFLVRDSTREGYLTLQYKKYNFAKECFEVRKGRRDNTMVFCLDNPLQSGNAMQCSASCLHLMSWIFHCRKAWVAFGNVRAVIILINHRICYRCVLIEKGFGSVSRFLAPFQQPLQGSRDMKFAICD